MRKILLFLYLLMVFIPAGATRPLLIESDHHSLAGHLELLIDERHEHTIETVANADFKDVDGQINLGFTKAAVWLRFSLTRPTNVDPHWWLQVAPTLLSHVTLFDPLPGGGYSARHTGNALGPETREVAHSSAVFPLTIESTSTQTYYLLVKSAPSLRVVIDLWQPTAFVSNAASEQSFFGLYAGLAFGMIVSSLWFWRTTKETGQLILASSALFLLLTNLFADAGVQHWLPLPASMRDPLLGCFIVLTSATGTQFVNTFTKLGDYLPRFASMFTRSVWAFSLLSCLGFWMGLYADIMPLAQKLIVLSVMLHSGFTTWLVKRGQRQSTTVLLALATFWAIIPIRFGQSLGWIPLINDGMLLHTSQIFYLLLLNYAGHQRYAAMRLENAHTQTLNEAVGRLEQANKLERATHQAHRQFVATISHEIRNPLAVIDASIQNMTQLGGPAFDEKTRTRIEKIQHATDRLTLIIDECLTPEHLDVPPDASQTKSVALRKFFWELEADAATFATDSHRVSVECDEKILVNCNPVLFKRALQTLFENALKYTPRGTVVRLIGQLDDSFVRIAVSDNGPGIDANDMPHIFEKYFRGRSSKFTPGTGLGLALAKQVIESHGGTLEVTSTQGVGTTATIRMPAAG